MKLLPTPIRALLAAICLVCSATAQDHPRLFISAGELPSLRQKLTQEPHRSMFEELKRTAELDQWGRNPQGKDRPDYDESTSAVRCALLYTLTGDDAWAAKSRTYVERRMQDKNWANAKTKGLTLYMNGRAVALAYDFCHGAPSWDAEFSGTVSRALLQMANVVFEKGGGEQNANPASNWQGLRWSTAGLMYLATDEPVDSQRIDQAYSRVVRYLTENLGSSSESRGWNAEGLGYTYFPMANGVVPFAIAMQRKDSSKDLRQAVPAAGYTLWTCYAALVPTGQGLRRPDFSDDNPHAEGEGSYGFAFYFSNPDLLPGLKYWYDRTVGLQGDRSFDRGRLGLVASLLFHPGEAVAEADPLRLPAWLAGFVDTGGNGYQTWRTRYQDSGDIVTQIYAKLRGNRGHNGPDALSFRIVGLDTLWATGGGRYGPKLNGQDAYWRSMNTVYPVDPDERLSTNENSGQLVGTPVSTPAGGHAVMKAAANNVGTTGHQRWFAVTHDAATGGAGWVVLDRSENGRFWQFCTLATNTITTEGNTFTVTSPEGHTLRGTVLHPASGVTFKTGKRIRGSDAGGVKENHFVHFTSEDGTFLVAMTLVPKGTTHPAVTAEGTWTGAPVGKVGIGPASISINGDQVSTPASTSIQ